MERDGLVAGQEEEQGLSLPDGDPPLYSLESFRNPGDRARIAPGFTWKDLYFLASNVAATRSAAHLEGRIVGDLNWQRTLANLSGVVTIVGPEPKHLGGDPNIEDERWDLAILIFALLMEGEHPTNGIGFPDERSRRLEQGLFPPLGEPGFLPPAAGFPFEALPKTIQDLFVQCFRDGRRNPSARPDASVWDSELKKAAASLKQCRIHEKHWFAGDAHECTWCAMSNPAHCSGEPGDQISLPAASTLLPQIAISSLNAADCQAVTPSARTYPFSVSIRHVAIGSGALVLLAAAILIFRPWSRSSPPTLSDANEEKIRASYISPPDPVAPLTPEVPHNDKALVTSPRPKLGPKLIDKGKVVASTSREQNPATYTRPNTPQAVELLTPPPERTVTQQEPPRAAPLPEVRQAAEQQILNIPLPGREEHPNITTKGFKQEFDSIALNLNANAPVPDRAPAGRGVMVWSGQLDKNVPLAIDRQLAAFGSLRGDPFPGTPVIIDAINPSDVIVSEPPAPSNGFQRLVLRSKSSRKVVITISWHTP